MRTTLLTILAIGAVFSPLAMAAERKQRGGSARCVGGRPHRHDACVDKGIPQDLMNKAQCVVVVPNMKKAGFIWGAKYGRGYAVCRRARRDRLDRAGRYAD